MRTDEEKLKDFRNSLRLSQQEFVNKLGMSLSVVSMVECGKRPLSHKVKERIKEIFNYNIDKEAYIQEKEFTTVTSNIIPIPFYQVKAAANPSGEILIDYPETQALYFDKRWLENMLGINPYNCSIIQAKGDSMDSGLNKPDDIKDGDMLLVDNSKTHLQNNKIYVVQVNQEELMVKKVFQDLDGKIKLSSANPNYNPRILKENEELILLGRVVWNGSKAPF